MSAARYFIMTITLLSAVSVAADECDRKTQIENAIRSHEKIDSQIKGSETLQRSGNSERFQQKIEKKTLIKIEPDKAQKCEELSR